VIVLKSLKCNSGTRPALALRVMLMMSRVLDALRITEDD